MVDWRMDVKKVTEQIGKLAREMIHSEESKQIQLFTMITVLLNELEDYNIEFNGNNVHVDEKIFITKWNARSIAKLDEGDQHSAKQHLTWLLGNLQTINESLMSKQN